MINRFYYSICSELEKKVYMTIFDGLSEFREMIFFGRFPVTFELVQKVLGMVIHDNPRIFYASTQGNVCGYVGNAVYLRPKYFFTPGTTLELMKWLDERTEEICAPVKDTDDSFAKEIYIHNYLVNNVNYSLSEVAQPINAFTVAGTLLENNSVCAGIALSFKLLMDHLDIPCIVASGNAQTRERGSERHAWNIVYIEGAHYQIDVTWDLIRDGGRRTVNYDYFNLTTQEMYRSRTPDYVYPLCDHREYNYFHYTGAVVNSREELRAYIRSCAARGDKYIYFKYTFDLDGMERNIGRDLLVCGLIGASSYCVNETEHTVMITLRR